MGLFDGSNPNNGFPTLPGWGGGGGGPSAPSVPSQPTTPSAPVPTQMDWNNPDAIALFLGQGGNTPGYNSKDNGSFERNYNAALGNLSPSELLSRYSQKNLNPSMLQTAQDRSGYQAYNSFKSMFGRDPNQNEFAQLIPAFQGPNGTMNGNAALANLQQQYKSNPSIDPTAPQNNQKPADVASQVNQQFQSTLGRAPTSDELAHFSQAIQTNQTDAYGLSSFLKQMPEYTNAQDKQFRGSLNNELAGYDQNTFDRMKGDVYGDYASRGMAPGSSPSLDYALTDLMGQMAKQRGQYLAGLSSQQYGGNKDLAIGNYQNTLDQFANNAQQNLSQNRAYGQQLMNQGFQGADYQSQMNNYMNFLQNNRGSHGANPIYGAIGGALGGGIGSFGGPGGAMAGYAIGSGLGNSYGYLNQ